MADTAKGRQLLLNVLEETARAIRTLESEAEACLERDDREGYFEKMREKAVDLTSLPEAVSHYLDALDEKMRSEVSRKVENFAMRANQALSVGSPFYMSQLLYPEDHREGEKNELERFADDLKSRL